MRQGNAIILEGIMKFTRRIDNDPRGLAFWLKVQLNKSGEQVERNLLFFDFCKAFAKNGLTPEGGEFGGWDWQLLITADEPSHDTTDEDREAIRAWFEARDDVGVVEVGPLVDPQHEYETLNAEWQQAQALLKNDK